VAGENDLQARETGGRGRVIPLPPVSRAHHLEMQSNPAFRLRLHAGLYAIARFRGLVEYPSRTCSLRKMSYVYIYLLKNDKHQSVNCGRLTGIENLLI
jgi:hypothetical protein